MSLVADIPEQVDQAAVARAHEPSYFQPGEGRTLWSGISLSGIMHATIATALIVYGAELTNLELHATAPQISQAPPIKATFLFEEKEEPELKPHLVPEKIAEAVKPKPKKVKPRKRVVRNTSAKKKTVSQTAPRTRKPKPNKVDAPVVKTAAVIAPAVANSSAATVAPTPSSSPQVASGPPTAAPATASPAGVESTIDRAGLLKSYVKTLSKAVRKRRSYPRAAKLAGLEGRAVVRIVLNAKGGIVAIELASSSGHAILDRAALEAARSVGTLPAAPSGLNWGTRAIKVPFSFKVAS